MKLHFEPNFDFQIQTIEPLLRPGGAPLHPLRSGEPARGESKLPFGNIPRLLLAWVSTEAVRTQRRVTHFPYSTISSFIGL